MPGKRCVHIIDDEAKIRDSLAVLLSTAEIKSRAYASAEEYLASVPLSEPACVILDNQLHRAGAGERIEHNLAALRAISDRIGDQSDRLCRTISWSTPVNSLIVVLP